MGSRINNQLELYCQPICRIDKALGHQVNDYEILLRDKQTGGFPVQFFQALKTQALVRRELEDWMVDQLTSLTQRCNANFAINIDPWQLAYSDTWCYLKRLRAVSSRLTIEVTERVAELNNQLDQFSDYIARLRKLGYKISFDDVSSGQFSLQVVAQNLAYIDRAKISLIAFQKLSPDQVKNILDLWAKFAQSVKIEFVVEGIETEAVAAELVKKDYVLQQGYYWQKPFPVSQLIVV